MIDNVGSEKHQNLYQKFTRKMRLVDDNNEDIVIKRLANRAGQEGWTVAEQHSGSEQGVDLRLQKGNRTVVIEAKGERRSQSQHGAAVRGALGAIVMRMTKESGDIAYCVAFPLTDAFRRQVASIPVGTRQRLKLNIILVEGTGMLSVVLPSVSSPVRLNSFDELFDHG